MKRKSIKILMVCMMIIPMLSLLCVTNVEAEDKKDVLVVQISENNGQTYSTIEIEPSVTGYDLGVLPKAMSGLKVKMISWKINGELQDMSKAHYEISARRGTIDINYSSSIGTLGDYPEALKTGDTINIRFWILGGQGQDPSKGQYRASYININPLDGVLPVIKLGRYETSDGDGFIINGDGLYGNKYFETDMGNIYYFGDSMGYWYQPETNTFSLGDIYVKNENYSAIAMQFNEKENTLSVHMALGFNAPESYLNVGNVFNFKETEWRVSPETVFINSQYDKEKGLLDVITLTNSSEYVSGKDMVITEKGGYEPGVPGHYVVKVAQKGKLDKEYSVDVTVVESKGKITKATLNNTSIFKLPDEYFNEYGRLYGNKFIEEYGDVFKIESQTIDGTKHTFEKKLSLHGSVETSPIMGGDAYFRNCFLLDEEYNYDGWAIVLNGNTDDAIEACEYYAGEHVSIIPIYQESVLLDLELYSDKKNAVLYCQNSDFGMNMLSSKRIILELTDNQDIDIKNKKFVAYNVACKSYDNTIPEEIDSVTTVRLGIVIPGDFNRSTTSLYKNINGQLIKVNSTILDNKIYCETENLKGTYVVVDEITIEPDIDNNPSDDEQTIQVIIPEGTPNISVSTGGISLNELITLNKEEQQLIDNGEKLGISLEVKKQEVKDIDEKIVKDIEKFVSNMSNKKIGMYLDISMFKELAGNTSAIYNLNKKIRITITIPKELLEKSKYSLIRYHDGKKEELYDLDTNPTTLTVETVQFSTYALVYEEIETSNAVDTSDTTASNGYILMMAICVLGAALLYKRNRVTPKPTKGR